jgi:Mce-associated membrane protein
MMMSVSTDDDKATAEKPGGGDVPEGSEAAAAESAGTEADTAADTEAADTEAGGDDDRPTARKWRRPVLRGALAAAFVVLLAAVGFLGWKLWQDDQVTRASEQAQATAVQYAQILTSIDSAKVDENFDAVLDGATGEFKDMYSKSSVELRQLLIDNKAAAHGVVVESAVQSASKDKVVVLLFVDQSVSNSAVPDPRIDRSRIKMTMENVDGRWRASKVELP